ncbi:histidine phosphotransferase family protein [Acuticoccus sp. I52.16.1]|uniref:histidine phosphotransferase family protein n=1 Tax=Acuticoccus sp. I52.16.1 TaxID=2928472 RepID=UPI001FD5DA08|nr:histidine phosphotransferase family protein [Acuticoccus sp. I52.16.1]UOM33850.1 histidine phosphotransferase family protein [Acuticoccus sp. I52.16.1]
MQSELDLASLMASRLCHDIVGPVGAIQNGLELMAEDEAMAEMAIDLIKKSAHQASAKLQFARMAYGAAGGADVLDPGEAGRLTGELFKGERASLDWAWAGPAEPRIAVKLGMLLATYALGAVPRGGTVTVEHVDGAITVTAAGDTLRNPPFVDVVGGSGDVTEPQGVQAKIIAMLAESGGWRVDVASDGSRMTFRTVPL